MDIFVSRDPKGFMPAALKDVDELGERLRKYGPLGDDDEVTMEITAPWKFIRELLSSEMFRNQWDQFV